MTNSTLDMMSRIEKHLTSAPVVPLIQSDDPVVAIKITEALVAGGLSVIEVVLRTPQALNCLSAIVRAVPDAIVGAGTVLNVEQAEAVVAAGAKFMVSPGFCRAVVGVAQAHDLPVYPGVMTPTEVQQAWNAGLRVLKFFPAQNAGGIAMIKSLAAVFGDMKFMPTGGISAKNLSAYLSVPAVFACGGSWLTPKAAVTARDYHVITKLAKEAVAIAATIRG